jgi:hypothetical protein
MKFIIRNQTVILMQKIVETFEAESETPIEIQQRGWQPILNHFKKYTEQTNYLIKII